MSESGVRDSKQYLTETDFAQVTVTGSLPPGTTADGKTEYITYKWRWYVLLSLAVLNFSNAIVSNIVGPAVGTIML